PTPGAVTVAPQVPRAAPPATTQLPPQQSLLSAQASFCCRQNDTLPSQVPLVHDLEQHWVPVVHALPEVRHVGLSGAQVPPVHCWLQHCWSLVHAWLSDVHCVAEHLLAMHEPEQHSM